MDRRGRTGEVVYLINLNKKRHCDIVPDQFKKRILQKVDYVLFLSGKVIVEANHFIALIQQSLAKMRSNKTGSSGN
jgi:hypothetical protein